MKPSWTPFIITILWLAFFMSSFVNDLLNMALCGLVMLSFFGLGCWWQHHRNIERNAK